MKYLWILIPALLAGCQSAPPPRTETPANLPALPQLPPPQPRDSDLETRLQQQRYVIDALLSQQEAWQAQASGERPAQPVKPMRFLPRKQEAQATPPAERTERFLQPDAGGVIDLSALGKKTADDSTNPFVVAPAVIPPREVVVSVQGVLPGPNPSAIINDRPFEVGDAVESLRLTRIDVDAAIFAAGEQQLRIPLGRPVRVHLP